MKLVFGLFGLVVIIGAVCMAGTVKSKLWKGLLIRFLQGIKSLLARIDGFKMSGPDKTGMQDDAGKNEPGDFRTPETDAFEGSLVNLQEKVERLSGQVQQLTDSFYAYESSIGFIKRQLRVTWENRSDRSLPEVVAGIEAGMNEIFRRLDDLSAFHENERVQVKAQIVAVPDIRYAYYPDHSTPSGFTANSLSTDPEGRFYEIEPTSDTTANFRVVRRDEYTKVLASFNAVFAKACCWVGEPRSENSRISTLEDGRLVLEGNVWVVCRPVKIKFTEIK